MVDAALISGLLTNLVPLINDEFSLFWSYKKEVQKLSSTLSSISAVLEDAERKRVREKDRQTEDWLLKLKHIVYEVRDIMDECTLKDLRVQIKRRNASSSTRIQVTHSITHPFINTRTRLKIGHKIKDVQEKLDQISYERQRLHLRESIHDMKSSSGRESMSIPTCIQVYGRDEEKTKIVDILVSNESSLVKELSVLPIVGIGGLGKTTLVKMVFDDDEVAMHFDTRIWVCVSEKFDVKLVIKDIIQATNETSLEKLSKKVRDQLKGKRYLIVLDDVWNENEEEWNVLRAILDCGSNGAFVLTTTRKRNVAKLMETIQHVELSSLSDNDCWLLFEERAFMHGTRRTPNFISIGREIVKKCKGVPLIAKTLGSQLGFKNDEKEWCRIRDNEISQNEEFILPILRKSYYDLPYHLRRCFAYCAVFPKGTKIEKERLIQMWIAHGLIPINENQEAEDVGNTIWNELCWRSFFQDETETFYWFGFHTTCRMHDLMHDLAQSIMKDECYTMDGKSSRRIFRQEIRHLTLTVKEFGKEKTEFLKEMRGLQSIILHPANIGFLNVSKEILGVLKKLSSLRVFEVYCDAETLDLRYVGCLKQLRYLNLSGSEITTLPNSICDLSNLQTLNLNNCFYLESLPRNTKDLVNLRHLYLKDCIRLQYMPQGMRQLIHLKTLSLFVIGKENDHCQLDELKELNIRGYLRIKNLGRVTNASIARGRTSFASQKSSINMLELQWEDNDEDDDKKKNRHEETGEALEVPTTSLKILKMRGYTGLNLPKWVRKSSDYLTHLEFYKLENVKHIFPINNSVSRNDNGMIVFPLLEEFAIHHMRNLRELVAPPYSTRAFPRLSMLEISYCPNLRNLPQHLKDLTVVGECSNDLLYNISNLSGLTDLHLSNLEARNILFQETMLFGNINETQGGRSSFQSLRHMKIEYCSKLSCLFDDGMMMSLPLLQTLSISDCQNLTSLSRKKIISGVTNLASLTTLHIERCPAMKMLLTEFGNLNSLQYLYIASCPKLVSSEEAIDVVALLTSLKVRLGRHNFHVEFLFDEDLA
ncbi:putative disease resistance protein RGA1 [Impatiens glandulifera]|uniref:putative disease resistance protein RGA1 n=1 Tax=Impatiens glandulifera TaxID=253017 RepID=UPI001FB0EFAC|nr:putative disease resistance protein RGA1 [Impatiens glandulifera]XP_047338706.1 putative disease resistance protein RGA1 [Impatiens glandulifera]